MDGYTLSISRCSGGDGVEESFKAKIKRREAALAGVVGADGGRRLHPVAKLVYELIHPVVANNHRIGCEGTKDLRDGGFAVNMRVRLEGREKVFPAARNGEGILHMVGSEGALSTMGYLHLEAG